MTITIRKMLVEDAPAVAAIEVRSFSEPWPEFEFVKAVEDRNYCYLVAAHSKEVVGYAGAIVSIDEADVTNIAVKTDFRNQGVGEELLKHLLIQVELRGVDKVFLEVRESNESAISLYRKYGFYQIGKRPGFYKRPIENALLMRKDINIIE